MIDDDDKPGMPIPEDEPEPPFSVRWIEGLNYEDTTEITLFYETFDEAMAKVEMFNRKAEIYENRVLVWPPSKVKPSPWKR